MIIELNNMETLHKHTIGVVTPSLRFKCSECGKCFTYGSALLLCELEYWRKLRHFREMVQSDKKMGVVYEGIYLPDEKFEKT